MGNEQSNYGTPSTIHVACQVNSERRHSPLLLMTHPAPTKSNATFLQWGLLPYSLNGYKTTNSDSPKQGLVLRTSCQHSLSGICFQLCQCYVQHAHFTGIG